MGAKLYHMGFQSKVSRSTLADANESRDWRIFADFAHVLIRIARPSAPPIRSVWISTRACMPWIPPPSICAWRCFRGRSSESTSRRQNAHPSRPARQYPYLHTDHGWRAHDVNILDEIFPEAGAFYVMDRGYNRLRAALRVTLSSAFFVVRTKRKHLAGSPLTRIPWIRATGVRSDHTVSPPDHYRVGHSLSGYSAAQSVTSMWRQSTAEFLTNNFQPPSTHDRPGLQVSLAG